MVREVRENKEHVVSMYFVYICPFWWLGLIDTYFKKFVAEFVQSLLGKQKQNDNLFILYG
jgi:hypothetical protein